MKGLGDIMKKAQEMQENMQKAQQELANREITGESGGGMVTVVMRGTHEVNRVTIDPALVGEDKEMLEDLLAAAVNDAVRRVERTQSERSKAQHPAAAAQIGHKRPHGRRLLQSFQAKADIQSVG